VERKVRLAEGQNWIEAVAIDEEGRASNRVRFRTIPREADKPRKRFIVAMGVSIYRDRDQDLEFAAKDASDLSRAIQDAFPGDSEVLLLRNEQVTREAPNQIREFLSTATENDEVVVFCAGHGVLDENLNYYYCSHEFDPDDPSGSCIELDELIGAIDSAKALNRILLLDTCHSGQVGEKDELLLARLNSGLPDGVRVVKTGPSEVPKEDGADPEMRRRFIEEMFSLPGLHRGLNIIGASAGAQLAFESRDWNNGVFTASILEGLAGKKADSDGDGRVSITELRAYSGERVAELTKGAQTPSVVAFEEDQDFHLLAK
jgi:uncharacterized caspase-like protein